jgi:hypothetical protein
MNTFCPKCPKTDTFLNNASDPKKQHIVAITITVWLHIKRDFFSIDNKFIVKKK